MSLEIAHRTATPEKQVRQGGLQLFQLTAWKVLPGRGEWGGALGASCAEEAELDSGGGPRLPEFTGQNVERLSEDSPLEFAVESMQTRGNLPR